ncbi:MAG: HlyD family secretion protein [Halioglobus sp.]
MNLTRKHYLTAAIAIVAIVGVLLKYWNYVVNPWTRDGQVRAEVIQVTPRISGPIVRLPIKDNQAVKAGDLLFEIDPRTYAASLDAAEAAYDSAVDQYNALEKQVDVSLAQIESSRAQIRQAESTIKQLEAQIVKDKAEYERQQDLLPKRATSQKSVDRAKANYDVSLQQREGAIASLAQTVASLVSAEADLAKSKATLGATGDTNANLRQALASVEQARLDLEFTQVRSTVDGYVTNLNLRKGSQAVANQPALALVDINSFWVHGYFRETAVEDIGHGDEAIVILMSYPDHPIQGRVDSLGWGIAQQDGSTGFELLPNISPTFEWIRLAQRVPVRVHLDNVPESVALRVGTTASVIVKTGTGGDN